MTPHALAHPVVVARGVSKTYPNGVTGLADLSLSVDPGQFVAVLGPSGAGKTTLFRLCNGSIRPTQGALEVLGMSTAGIRGHQLRDLRRQVAVIYQNHNLVASLSVLQNVLLGRLGAIPLIQGLRDAFAPPARLQWRVYELLEELGIGDKLRTRVDELSGGQQQRVAVARALIQEPELLLADEPVASVDRETAIAILDLLSDVCRHQGTTVVVSLHQTEYVERYCDRAIELRGGRLAKSEAFSRNGASSPQRQEVGRFAGAL